MTISAMGEFLHPVQVVGKCMIDQLTFTKSFHLNQRAAMASKPEEQKRRSSYQQAKDTQSDAVWMFSFFVKSAPAIHFCKCTIPDLIVTCKILSILSFLATSNLKFNGGGYLIIY
ncbi:unnamed protein product [Prunus armeniaca]|uniref:Uncharacterized protein n=1 Tax=Prunus armeniaca TaxID=36596 RepID=A0A6J5WSZ0_PRUAR|nr:unnamed protein product [Prunus armeniaca]